MSDTKFGPGPQRSVFGPILFIMYTADVIRIVERFGLGVHQYADNVVITSSVHGSNRLRLCLIQSSARGPQRSVFGPILFIMYTADVIRIVERFGLGVHQYADDTQIHGSCRPNSSASL